MEQTQTE